MVAGRRARRSPRVYSRGARLPDVRHRLPRAVAAELLVQHAARHVRRVQRPRRRAWRSIPISSSPIPTLLDPRRRDRAVGRARSRKDAGWTSNIVKALAKAFKIDLDKPWNKLGDEAARGAAVRHRRQARQRRRGKAGTRPATWAMRFEGILTAARAPLPRDRLGAIARSALRAVLPRDRRARPATARACGPSRARCSSPSKPIVDVTGDDRARRRYDVLHDAEAHRRARADRRRGAQGDQRAGSAFLLDVGLDYLTLDRAAEHAVGRRGAAHPARVAARQRAVGRDVRARRAVDRPAPARQRAADRARCTGCATSATRVLVVEHDEETIEAAD